MDSVPASPLRENQLGIFNNGENFVQPPTPPSNIRNLIAQKEKVREEQVPPLPFTFHSSHPNTETRVEKKTKNVVVPSFRRFSPHPSSPSR